MSDTAPYGLEPSELDELHEFLGKRADAGGLMLDAVHGLLTAVVIGPDPISASEWLGHVIDQEQGFETEEQANRILALLIRLYNSVVQELDALAYQPIFGEVEMIDSDETELSARGWCEGFSIGVDLRSALWEGRMQQDPELLELLNPVIALAAEEGVFEPIDGETIAPLSDDEFENALNGVAGSVADVQQYWRNKPPEISEGLDPHATGKPVLRKRGGHWLH
jgi:uncharacterized protein